MAMSTTARQGLHAAVEYNPDAAATLLGILREAAACVKYKPGDTYGPIGLIIGELPRRRLAQGISVPVNSRPLPEETLAACRIFNEEWLRRDFSKRELADTLEAVLTEIAPDVIRRARKSPSREGPR
jgi:hypothetical protein